MDALTKFCIIQVINLNLRLWITIHGVLMAASFILLMPTGILLARFRVLYLSRTLGRKALWYYLHLGESATSKLARKRSSCTCNCFFLIPCSGVFAVSVN